ncbi:EAL domain-containing protein [Roseibium sp. AS2]|uniref:EAL domain-containing protein n=1 Tax=Roseibium sp. AS2 TaxID=3135781 RepID=UPI0031747EA9
MVQVSHRLIDGRLDQTGRADSDILSDFHASLLEVLPNAAAFITQDGSILVHNTRLKTVCADRGVLQVPARLKDLLAESSWNRCEAVLAAAFAGVPAQASGTILLRSGEVFCRHLICTTFIALTAARRAVLVQFDLADSAKDEIATPPVGQTASPRLPAAEEFLAQFPDDIVIFNGTESAGEKAAVLLDAISSNHDADLFAETLEGLDAGRTQSLYVPETRSFETAAFTDERQMCEIRIVPIPAPADGTGKSLTATAGASRTGASMAIIRRNVDCPRETAENRRLAYLDPLTGLENRRAFTRALKRKLCRLAGDGAGGVAAGEAGGEAGDQDRDRTAGDGLAVFYIDLDEFKKVNDLGGHDVGDDMLLRVAACLRATLGEVGTAARIGGDEFAGMVPAASEEAALELAGKILDGFDRIRLEVGDRVFTIGGSIGVAFVGDGLPLGATDAALILGLADRACLRGKRFGGRSVQIHTVAPAECRTQDAGRAELPEPGSFRGNELTLFAMPIIRLKDQQVFGSEILLRLQGDRAAGLSSRAWISAAERSGVIAKVDAWTLDKVLDAAECNTGRAILTMNVSVESARDPGFRDGLYHRLSANPLLASKLCLEIGEKDFLREPAVVEAFFKFVTDLGCQTAVDDFAGHWPVLSRLTGLRVEWLKLEAGLTQQVVEAPGKAAILAGLVRAAHELGIKVIAKHVETAREARLLGELNIEAAQGYYFGKPAPWPGR